MESRIQRIFLRLVVLVSTPLFLSMGPFAVAQTDGEQQVELFEPEIKRTEIEKPKIDTEDFEIGMYAGLISVEDFGTNSVAGGRLAYHVSEHLFVEAAYGQTDTEETSFETLNPGVQLIPDDDRTLQYYNLSVGYNLLPGEVFFYDIKTFVSSLYLIAGVGSTDFAGDTFFTVNWGVGYRFLVTDVIALHLDVRDHMFDIDILGEDKTTHNIELNFSITTFF